MPFGRNGNLHLLRWPGYSRPAITLFLPFQCGGVPNQRCLKGFIDRLLVPHFAFRYREKGELWDRLLGGRSADALVSMDTPSLFMRFVYRNAIVHRWKGQIFDFCGFKPARFEIFAPVREGKADAKMPKWLERVAKLAHSIPSARGVKQSHLEAFLAYGSNRLESP